MSTTLNGCRYVSTPLFTSIQFVWDMICGVYYWSKNGLRVKKSLRRVCDGMTETQKRANNVLLFAFLCVACRYREINMNACEYVWKMNDIGWAQWVYRTKTQCLVFVLNSSLTLEKSDNIGFSISKNVYAISRKFFFYTTLALNCSEECLLRIHHKTLRNVQIEVT